MTMIFVHLGSRLPLHLWAAVKQARKFFSGRIIVYGSDEFTCYDGEHDCHILGNRTSEIEDSPRCHQFENTSFLGQFGKFWNHALKRLFVLEEIIRRETLRDVLHIENDVMIYSDPETLPFESFCAGRAGVTICPATDKHAMYAYCWVRDFDAIKAVNDKSLAILREGRPVLSVRYGDAGWVNEQHIANQLMHEGHLTPLPTMPGHDGARQFAGIFDAAALGQFVTGTPSDPPGFADNQHWMGRALKEGRYVVKWHDGKPFLYDSKKSHEPARIHNLHVHSKKMELAVQ